MSDKTLSVGWSTAAAVSSAPAPSRAAPADAAAHARLLALLALAHAPADCVPALSDALSADAWPALVAAALLPVDTNAHLNAAVAHLAALRLPPALHLARATPLEHAALGLRLARPSDARPAPRVRVPTEQAYRLRDGVNTMLSLAPELGVPVPPQPRPARSPALPRSPRLARPAVRSPAALGHTLALGAPAQPSLSSRRRSKGRPTGPRRSIFPVARRAGKPLPPPADPVPAEHHPPANGEAPPLHPPAPTDGATPAHPAADDHSAAAKGAARPTPPAPASEDDEHHLDDDLSDVPVEPGVTIADVDGLDNNLREEQQAKENRPRNVRAAVARFRQVRTTERGPVSMQVDDLNALPQAPDSLFEREKRRGEQQERRRELQKAAREKEAAVVAKKLQRARRIKKRKKKMLAKKKGEAYVSSSDADDDADDDVEEVETRSSNHHDHSAEHVADISDNPQPYGPRELLPNRGLPPPNHIRYDPDKRQRLESSHSPYPSPFHPPHGRAPPAPPSPYGRHAPPPDTRSDYNDRRYPHPPPRAYDDRGPPPPNWHGSPPSHDYGAPRPGYPPPPPDYYSTPYGRPTGYHPGYSSYPPHSPYAPPPPFNYAPRNSSPYRGYPSSGPPGDDYYRSPRHDNYTPYDAAPPPRPPTPKERNEMVRLPRPEFERRRRELYREIEPHMRDLSRDDAKEIDEFLDNQDFMFRNQETSKEYLLERRPDSVIFLRVFVRDGSWLVVTEQTRRGGPR